jgi:hypothetical protein
LRAEAADAGLPLEVVENRAIREAALDVATSYNLDSRRIASMIASLVVKYAQ